MAKNYYEEIDKVIAEYEEYKPWHTKTLDWAADRIEWCWRWRKITEEQMKELAGRATDLYARGDN